MYAIRSTRSCLIVLVTACATNSAPAGFVPSQRDVQQQAWGAWIEVDYAVDGTSRSAAGELIAVGRDTAWILGERDGIVVPTSAVRTGKLTAYSSQTGAVAGGTALGTLSTISNGLFLVFTAPLWVITGTVAGASQSHVPERRLPEYGWKDLAVFARFPAGLPDGVRIEKLARKRL